MISGFYEIVKITKPTKAYFFRNLEIGHRIRFSAEVKRLGQLARGGSYAASIKTENIHTGEEVYNTYNDLANRLECFELKKI